ncbi:hypothetical protein EZS27_002245 [termite gut metagenome]|uniref:Peptidase M64 N-terminal domain-containing protein n=1 Tax=termite gut metagenome TaxID=433724 RepID=A0A5J4SYW0_9ZZZZ
MKKKQIFVICLFFVVTDINAQIFTEYFTNNTLRIDYVFTGNASQQAVYLDELSQLPSWAGRRTRLSELPLEGNGQVVMKDLKTKKCIYKVSFSSLFQEWLVTDEAKETSRAFENTFLLPYPLRSAEIEITLYNAERKVATSMKHSIHPDDILIHVKGTSHITPHTYLVKNDNEQKCIDIAILAEGYMENEMNIFYQDANMACESLFSHEPFKALKKKFNIVAVASPSADSGVSIPKIKQWNHTAFDSHFSTFYSDRYLTTNRVKAIHDALAGIPYEHIIVLVNTEKYGGGGIYNTFTLTAAHRPEFCSVVVHEFGHSFGGLADEYFYEDDDTSSRLYPQKTEPWEQNITTQVDFASKWKDRLPKNTPIPTPVNLKDKYPIGIYEGGGYLAKGIYRPSFDCRMKTNEYPSFCPVCQRVIERMIRFYTE